MHIEKIHFIGSKEYVPSDPDMRKAHEDDPYTLQRLATEYKEANDWGGALACLYKSKELFIQDKGSLLDKDLMRLPLFLQQAGFFEEAKTELQMLYGFAGTYAELTRGALPTDDREIKLLHSKTVFLYNLFDKAKVIYKRENLIEQANNFALISAYYWNILQIYNEFLSALGKERSDYYKKNRKIADDSY